MNERPDDEERVESYAWVPTGSLVMATIVVCAYLGPDGKHGFAVRAHGDSPGTTYLGLLVRAQNEVLAWSDDDNE